MTTPWAGVAGLIVGVAVGGGVQLLSTTTVVVTWRWAAAAAVKDVRESNGVEVVNRLLSRDYEAPSTSTVSSRYRVRLLSELTTVIT